MNEKLEIRIKGCPKCEFTFYCAEDRTAGKYYNLVYGLDADSVYELVESLLKMGFDNERYPQINIDADTILEELLCSIDFGSLDRPALNCLYHIDKGEIPTVPTTHSFKFTNAGIELKGELDHEFVEYISTVVGRYMKNVPLDTYDETRSKLRPLFSYYMDQLEGWGI